MNLVAPYYHYHLVITLQYWESVYKVLRHPLGWMCSRLSCRVKWNWPVMEVKMGVGNKKCKTKGNVSHELCLHSHWISVCHWVLRVCALVLVCKLNALPKEKWFCPSGPHVYVAMVAVDSVRGSLWVWKEGVFDLFLWPESARLTPAESHGWFVAWVWNFSNVVCRHLKTH